MGNSISCQGRHLFFGGFDDSNIFSSKVFEYDMDEYQVMTNLNIGRSQAGCCYHNKKLIVAGGAINGTFSDSIVMLNIQHLIMTHNGWSQNQSYELEDLLIINVL